MKILIVSDSHGERGLLEELNQMFSEEIDLKIHCGDSELFEEDILFEGYTAVKGNCDNFTQLPEESLLTQEGVNIFATHGHNYGVKLGLHKLLLRAKELDANIVCFGHSHILGFEKIDNILFVNPGSLSRPVGRKECTYVIMSITNQQVDIKAYDANHKELHKSSYII